MDDNDNIDAIDIDSPEARRDMNKRHADLGRKMQAVALLALAELERKAAEGKLDVSREDAEKLLASGAKIEREATGKKKPN